MTMNWKWEAKMDNTREAQREYEERKRRETAHAKSVEELRTIERNMGKAPTLRDLQLPPAINANAIAVAQREIEIYRDQMHEALRYSMGSQMLTWAGIDRTPALAQPPLPEEHIVSAVVGFRAWNVPLFVDELRSVAKSSKWKPFQRFEASCETSQCSGVSCQCGIYAFNKMDLVQKEYTQQDRSKRYVYGECWLWGRVLECAHGYRAQFAYPKAFVNNGAIAKRMAEVFGVTLLTTSKR